MTLDSKLRKVESVVGRLEELQTLLDQVPDWIEQLRIFKEEIENLRKKQAEPDAIDDAWDKEGLSVVWDRLEAKVDDRRLSAIPILNPDWDAEVAAATGSPIRPQDSQSIDRADDPGSEGHRIVREWLAEKMADPVNHLETLRECRRKWPAEFAQAKAALPESKRVALEALLANAAVPEPQAVATIDPSGEEPKRSFLAAAESQPPRR